MAHCSSISPLIFLLLSLLLQFYSGKSELQLNYYSESCPKAEEIIKDEVVKLYHKHGNTAVSWIRNLFHDCIVKSCDASLLLESTINGIESEKRSTRNFGMRNFKYIVLSSFQSVGVDVEGTVALLGAHSVGRVHCINVVDRLYPTVDPTLDPEYAEYLKGRCPNPQPDPSLVEYARNDRDTPMVLDNKYYSNILSHKGLLLVDRELVSDPTTYPFVEKMAADNGYFHEQFSRALLFLSENNPLAEDQGEIRKDCRYVNGN